MALIRPVPAVEVATAVARALETILGHDVVLAVGDPVEARPEYDLLPEEPTRSIALPFANGPTGEITLVVAASFALSIEATTPDASLLNAAMPALQGGAHAMRDITPSTNPDHAGEISTETLISGVVGAFATVSIFESDTHVASVVIRLVDDEPVVASLAPAPVAPAPAAPTPAPTPNARPSTVPVAIGAGAELSSEVARHEFLPLGNANPHSGDPRPLALLNDVNMEVIAELGRMRMTVRDLIALAPGSVIELDRAAGSPVDVLVNGALLAHGEVVVIDEEFGVRVSDIFVGDN
jgi:flagellar motor switch protein FliN